LISCWALGRLKMGNDKRYVDALADVIFQFHWRNICRRRTNSSVFQVNKTRWSYIIKIKSLNIDGDEWKYVLLYDLCMQSYICQ
jgi:hypothetical protein